MIDSTAEHTYYARDSVHTLARSTWPEGRPLALAFVISAEYYDLYARPNAFTPPNVPGGFGRGPYPDFRAFSTREYGNRVGVFRLMRTFADLGLRATLAADAWVARTRPEVVRKALALEWDIVGHGLSVTDVIGEHMTDSEERAYLQESLAPLESLLGRTPSGWHGAEYAESRRTPALLAERGIRYLLDWPHDERPVPMSTPGGTVLSLPMSADLDDVMAHWHRKVAISRWVVAVRDAVDQLCRDGIADSRLLIVNLHGWLMGQPSKVSYLEELLADLAARKDVWFTTTDAIATHALEQAR